MPQAWLFMAVGDDRQHAGNDGYDDEPDAYYSWDSTVPNHKNPREGDFIAIWNKQELIGASQIEEITGGTDTKIIKKCPQCERANIKKRKNRGKLFRCHAQNCKAEFDDPLTIAKKVTTFRSRHDAAWVELEGVLTGQELRELCVNPTSQLSLRRLDWNRFVRAVKDQGTAVLPKFLMPSQGSRASDGHRRALVRVRRGQARFRRRLLNEYGFKCAFTGPAPKAVLEAAHLYSYAELGEHKEHGGLLLRRDIHRLFDGGQLAVDPSTSLIDVSQNVVKYDAYKALLGRSLSLRLTEGQKGWLKKHWSQHRG
ncbi:HNH endonuclease [Gemmatimonadales bacterium]|nr:HNH endonuclease [Gemmatimonadales bacterium]